MPSIVMVLMQEVLGEQVRGVGSLHTARGKAQKGLSAARMRGLERKWRTEAAEMGWEGGVRLTACGGKEAAWVTAVPSRPQYRSTTCGRRRLTRPPMTRAHNQCC
eukprot:COSAG05_NODE_4123_length_1663_cov_10.683882_1_plen_105_part_00